MHAVVIHDIGGPEVLSYESVPVPQPGEGQVRVKVEAAGLNFLDVYQRSGLSRLRLPTVLGVEAAGVVDAVGPQVSELKPGAHVAYAMRLGAYAEYAIVPAERLVPMPDGIESQQAAALLLQGMTAHYLTHSTYPIRPGDTALVHAAAGGVGLLLVQLVKRQGGWVVGTASTEEKAQLARQAGADEMIVYTETDFAEQVKRLTGGRGVHVVYDSVGRTTFDRSLSCLRPRGCLVLFGQSSGAVPAVEIDALTQGSLFLTRPGLLHHIADRQELLGRAGDLFRWLAAGDLHLTIDRTFPLAEVVAAHRYIEARRTKGKVLLIP